MNDTTPGFYTTEFWTMLGSQIVNFLVLLHWATASDAASLNAAVQNGAVAVVSLIVAGTAVWKYIHSRMVVKTNPAAASVDVKTEVKT